MPLDNTPTTPAATPPAAGQPTPAAPPADGLLNSGANAPKDDGKPADGGAPKPADADAGKKDDTKPDDKTVPEVYDIKMPEGVELDAAAATEFGQIAKELKLSAADAQRLADVAVSMQQRQAETFAATVKEWEKQSRADAEFGGDNLKENMATAQKALDTFGSPALIETLKTFGLVNHPEMIRMLFKAGKAISSDSFIKGGAPSETNDVPLAKRLYPNLN